MKCSNNKLPLLIGFEGIICNTPEYEIEEIPEMIDGAENFLKKLHDLKYYEIILYSKRDKNKILKWLTQNNIKDYVDRVTNERENAVIYMDIQNLNFSGDYNFAYKKIQNFLFFKNFI